MPLRITQVDASDAPIIRVGLTGGEDPVTGDVHNVVVLEDGEPNTTGNVYAGQVGRRQQFEDSVIMLAIDSSLSMKGDRIHEAMRAANVVLDHVHGGDRVGLMTFGGKARVLVPPTSDFGRVRAALASPPELTFGTVLYDTITRATDLLPDTTAAHRTIVVLTDGEDVGSDATLAQAASAAREAGVELVAVGISDEGKGAKLLPRLAEQADGSYHAVEQASDLTALYQQLSIALLRTHWVEFNSMRGGAKSVELTIDVPGQDPVTRTVVMPPPSPPRPLVPESARPQPVVASDPVIPLPDGTWVAWVAALPIGFMLLFGYLTWVRAGRRRRLQELVGDGAHRRSAVEPEERSSRLRLRRRRTSVAAQVASRPGPITRAFGQSAIGRRLTRTIELARVSMSLEQLAWASLVVAVGATVAIELLLANPLASMVAAMVGTLAVPGCLSFVASRRRREFEQQVPNALGAIASALRAGHGFDQALASMTADAPEPIASEFRRALEEARLGRPIEEGLEAIAQRYESREFDFVVTTVAIQRQVGGSLAEILEIVTNTLRQRLTFRRKVRALTSMGRMSVWVLVGLPFLIAGAMSLINPEFLTPLLTTDIGHLLLIGAAVSMTIGWYLCRRIVDIRV
jgi:tight adherence protein B